MNRKPMRNFWIDVMMGLLALGVGLSAFMLWVVLPQGYFAARLLWIRIHKWSGLGLSMVTALHVAVHWRWLVRMTRQIVGNLPHPGLWSPRDRRRDAESM